MMICDTKDGQVLLCNSCYQDDDGAKLSFWIPDDPENWPQTCERCDAVIPVKCDQSRRHGVIHFEQ